MHPPSDLGHFLNSRRSELRPEDIGMSSGSGRRRVRGLRRQEVAVAAGISLGYYTRMEQGHVTRVSSAVVGFLAKALRLTEDETRQLRRVAGADERPGRPAARNGAKGTAVSPVPAHVLAALTGVPALVIGKGMAVLEWNRPAAVLLGDFAHMAPAARNLARLTFLDDTWRSLYADWRVAARLCVTHLWRQAAAEPEDPDVTALVGELAVKSVDFRVYWAQQPARGRAERVVTVQHSIVGHVELVPETLVVADDPDQSVLVLTPAGDASKRALRLLLARTTETDGHTGVTSDSRHTPGP
ncbi:helix-turn-helix domain-containing protein [Streptomyces sp. NPDC005791]|uniref:helix-turn-helix domain-containing protein n=1 Tax=Streptomyces sp. NPDC005791 TaxID=3364732 RepID=UPI0036AA1CA9